MSGQGFSYVPVEGFSSLARELEQGAWGELDIRDFLEDASPRRSPLEASRLQGMKLQLHESCQALIGVAALEGETLALRLDREWDAIQRELDAELAVHAARRRDPARQAAALRCRKALLAGRGTAQTQLTLEKEVDWGRNQAALVSKAPLSDDFALLGLASLVSEIASKTEELAAALGMSKPEAPLATRSARVRELLLRCVRAANLVVDELEFFLDLSSLREPERQQVEALLAPLLQIAARYAPTKTDTGDSAPPPAASPAS